MSTLKDIADRYIQSWNIVDPKARRAEIDRLFSESCTYTDPMGSVAGRDGVDGFIEAVQKQFAGVSFALAGNVDAHHDVGRFQWHATVGGKGEPLAIGFDVMTVEGDQIKRIVGFLDKAPNA